MDPAAFRNSTEGSAPPIADDAALAGLWWAAKGDWAKAHSVVQADESSAAAWVHAYLHRVEGDLGNAAYWYRRAGRTPASEALDQEWDAIADALLRARP